MHICIAFKLRSKVTNYMDSQIHNDQIFMYRTWWWLWLFFSCCPAFFCSIAFRLHHFPVQSNCHALKWQADFPNDLTWARDSQLFIDPLSTMEIHLIYGQLKLGNKLAIYLDNTMATWVHFIICPSSLPCLHVTLN